MDGLTDILAALAIALRRFAVARKLIARLEARGSDPSLVGVLWETMGMVELYVGKQSDGVRSLRRGMLACRREPRPTTHGTDEKSAEEEAESASTRKRIALRLAGHYKLVGRFDEAIGLLDELLQEPRSTVEPLLLAASCYHATGDLPKARQLCQEALSLDNRCGPAYFRLCDVALDLGQTHDAIAYAESGLDQDPGNAAGHALLALSHLAAGNLADAVLCATKATQRSQENKLAYLVAADALRRLGESEEALDWLAQVQSRWPKEAKAEYQRALCYLDLGRPDKVEESIRTLADLPGTGDLVSDIHRLLDEQP